MGRLVTAPPHTLGDHIITMGRLVTAPHNHIITMGRLVIAFPIIDFIIKK